MDIFNNNCFNIFPQLEPNSVDLVVVDLPYGQISRKWDCLIDLDKMWIELKRICKRNCLYVFFVTTKFGVSIINSKPNWFKYDLVWEKSKKVGFLSANKMPLRKHEMIYVFGDNAGGKKTYTPQKVKGKPYKASKRKQNNYYRAEDDKYPIQVKENKGDRHPHSILKFNNPHKPVHNTQKPVDLCEWLIKSYSNEGDIVLDFTMGSGSTGVACKNTNRKFIGIEMDKDIFEIAKKRLEG